MYDLGDNLIECMDVNSGEVDFTYTKTGEEQVVVESFSFDDKLYFSQRNSLDDNNGNLFEVQINGTEFDMSVLSTIRAEYLYGDKIIDSKLYETGLSRVSTYDLDTQEFSFSKIKFRGNKFERFSDTKSSISDSEEYAVVETWRNKNKTNLFKRRQWLLYEFNR